MKKYFFILFILISGNFIFSNNYVYASSCLPILHPQGYENFRHKDIYIAKYESDKFINGFKVEWRFFSASCRKGLIVVKEDSIFLKNLVNNSNTALVAGVYQVSVDSLSNIKLLSEHPSTFLLYRFYWDIKSIFGQLGNLLHVLTREGYTVILSFMVCNVLLVFLFIKFLKKMRSKNVIEKP